MYLGPNKATYYGISTIWDENNHNSKCETNIQATIEFLWDKMHNKKCHSNKQEISTIYKVQDIISKYLS